MFEEQSRVCCEGASAVVLGGFLWVLRCRRGTFLFEGSLWILCGICV